MYPKFNKLLPKKRVKLQTSLYDQTKTFNHFYNYNLRSLLGLVKSSMRR